MYGSSSNIKLETILIPKPSDTVLIKTLGLLVLKQFLKDRFPLQIPLSYRDKNYDHKVQKDIVVKLSNQYCLSTIILIFRYNESKIS